MILGVLAVAIHATRPVPGKSWALKYRFEIDGPRRLRRERRTRVKFQLAGLFLFICAGSSN